MFQVSFFTGIEVRKKLFCYHFFVSKSAYLENLLTYKVRRLQRPATEVGFTWKFFNLARRLRLDLCLF